MKSQSLNSSSGMFAHPANRGASSRSTFWGLISTFITKFLGAIPLCMRVFLRKRIGSMAISLVGLLFASLWVRFILDGTYQIHELTPPETFSFEQFNKGSGVKYYFAVALWYIGIFFAQFGGVITKFISPDIADGIDSIKEVIAHFPFFLSLGVIIAGLCHFWQIRKLRAKRQVFNPINRGESLIFEPLLNLIKPRNRSLTLVCIEVIFLLLLAGVFYLWSFNNPEWLDYSVLFLIGAVGLAIEEWTSQHQLQKELEFRFANEFKALDLQDTYQQYKRGVIDTSATVSFVAFTTPSPPTLQPIMPSSSLHSLSKWRAYLSNFKNKTWIYGTGTVLFLLILGSIFAFKNSDEIKEVGLVQTLNLSVRQNPSLSAKSIGMVPQGTVLKIYDSLLGSNDDYSYWCKIKYNGQIAYVAQVGSSGNNYMWSLPISLYELAFDNLPYEDKVITYEEGHLNLMSSPEMSSTVVSKIAEGETVSVIGMAGPPIFLTVSDELIFGSWCLIEYQDQQGYVFSWYLDELRIPKARGVFDGLPE